MSGDNGPYYDVTLPDGRTVSCNDVIDALGMSFNRGEAFKACADLVDETKHRLPVWKHQVFTDGTDEWVNCA